MKLPFLVIISVVLYVSASPLKKGDLEAEWSAFKLKYGKKYKSPSEEEFRKTVFTETYNGNVENNELYNKGLVSFTMGINKYSDKTTEEINKTRKGYRRRTKTIKGFEGRPFVPDKRIVVPDKLDWRVLGAVTAVKDQKSCGACWAFSAVGALESHYYIKHGHLRAISEQNLIDCSKEGTNEGCGGGDPDDGFAYVHFNDGIDSEKSYPYKEKNGICRFKKSYNVTSVKLFGNVELGNEDYLKATIATMGPVATDIYTDKTFDYYTSGVYYNPKCKKYQPTHSVLVVGYGTTTAGKDYWIVKNSWGETWGENGYIRMARNRDNHCGIATTASFPIMY